MHLFSDLGARPRTVPQGFMSLSRGAEDPRVVRMAQQVKDVLPDIPLRVITMDLCTSPPNTLPLSFLCVRPRASAHSGGNWVCCHLRALDYVIVCSVFVAVYPEQSPSEFKSVTLETCLSVGAVR